MVGEERSNEVVGCNQGNGNEGDENNDDQSDMNLAHIFIVD